MAFKIANSWIINANNSNPIITSTIQPLASNSGIPAMYGIGDITTPPSNIVQLQNGTDAISSGAVIGSFYGRSVAAGEGKLAVGASGRTTNLLFLGSVWVYDLSGNHTSTLYSSDGQEYDQFGASVAIGNGKIVVGAPTADPLGTDNAGAVYVFDLSGNQLFKLLSSDVSDVQYFGSSVAIGNGRIVVGAHSYMRDNNKQGAYIYDLNGNFIKKVTPDAPSQGSFGYSVSVGSGRIAVACPAYGASLLGATFIYDLDGNFITKLVGEFPYQSFGQSLSIGNGMIAVSGAQQPNSSALTTKLFDIEGNLLYTISGTNPSIGCGRIITSAVLDNMNYERKQISIYNLDADKLIEYTYSTPNYTIPVTAVSSGKIIVGLVGGFADVGTAYIYDTPEVITPYEVQDWERV